MNEIRYPRWLAGIGVLGGVAIALGMAYLVLAFGGDLSGGAKVALIILGLAAGSILALASAVVGIAMPSKVADAAIVLDGCCGPPKTPSVTEGGEE